MRPIRLTMTAFGPYKNTETINFKELDELQLFVISGATGAGKTTIFDAICFALYGVASGTDRENVTMLRSHFADDDLHTKVEFIFEIKERTYRVLRQIGHVKGGNKSKTGEKYELYEQIGPEEIPCVDRKIVTEINEKIEQLIGLTEDQFKQIVMLPQGEFRKLLTSETENKGEILRRLFNTEKYNHMNGLLKEKRDQVIGEYQQQQLQLRQTIHSIHGSLRPFEGSETFATLEREYYEPRQVLHSLEADLTHLGQAIAIDEKQYTEAIQTHEKEQTLYHEGLALNKQLEELEQKKKELARINEEKEKIKEEEYHLKQANEAHQLKPYETQLIETETEQRHKKAETAKQTALLNKAEIAFEKAQQAYEKEKKQESTRDKLKMDVQKYKDFLPLVKNSVQTKAELETMEQHLKEAASQIEADKKQQKKQQEAIRKLKETMKQQDTDASKVHELKYNLEQTKKQFTLLRDYQKDLAEKDSLKNKAMTEKQVYDKAFDHYQQLEKSWLNAQAVLLAEGLVETEACPVCGSTHHPAPAATTNEDVTKESLERQRDQANVAKQTYENTARELNVLIARIKEKANDIKAEELDATTDTLETAIDKQVEQGKKGREAYDAAQTSHEALTRNKKELEEMEQRQEKLTGKLESNEKAYYAEQNDFTSRQVKFTEAMKEIPTQLQEVTVLKETIKQQQATLEVQNAAWEQAQQALEQTKEEKQRLTTTVQNIEKQLTELDDKVVRVQEVFEGQLREAGFTDQTVYQQAKLSESEREQLEKKIENHKSQHRLLTEQISHLNKELQGKEAVNLRAINENLEKLKQQYETALEKWNRSKQEKEAVVKLIEQIDTLATGADEKEQEASTIKDLHDVLRGQNDRKISFERYLQIDYLDNIIETANQRFQELMNGQFYLMRSDRQEAYGKQSGLAIDVFDSYTGQTRDVKTLSGGEKFIASLCLALGMSDVIQSFQGSISIQTMFIDEGFGSLDEESLHKSIQALIRLQEDGRLIGVISHVEELKTIFPAMLEVTKTKDGHSTTKFKIK